MLLTDHRPDAGRGRTRAAAPAVPAGLSGGIEKKALILPTLFKQFGAIVLAGALASASSASAQGREFYKCLGFSDTETAAICLVTLGNSLGAAGKLEEAEQAFLEAVRLSPGSTMAAAGYSGLGGVYGRQKKYPEAVKALTTALTIKPDNEVAWSDLGAVYVNLGRADEAIRAYTKCLSVATIPEIIDDAHLNLTHLYLQQNDGRHTTNNYIKLYKRNSKLAVKLLAQLLDDPILAARFQRFQDPLAVLGRVPFGARRSEARNALTQYDLNFEEEESTIAGGFVYLGQPADAGFSYVKGVVGRKFIRLYAPSPSVARTVFEKAVATVSHTYGRPAGAAELNDTAIWLSDPLLVSVSLFKERDNLTVVFQHRTFYPEVEKYFRGGR